MRARTILAVGLCLVPVALGGLLLGIAVVFTDLYFPTDRYRCIIKGLPPDVNYVSVVADMHGTIDNINFILPSEVGPPREVHPTILGIRDDNRNPNNTIIYKIAYRYDADRYGVLLRRRAGAWEIRWIESLRLAHEGWRENSVEMDCNSGRSEIPSMELLSRLGMEKVDRFFEEPNQ